MGAVVVLTGLGLAAFVVVLTAAGLFLKLLLRIVLLPLLLVKVVLMGTVMLVVGPILFVIGLVAALAVGLAVAVPLLPVIAIGGLLWLLVRDRRPAAAC
jgi:hypothetical protein